MHLRAYEYTPGMWNMLRYLDAYGQAPAGLLTEVGSVTELLDLRDEGLVFGHRRADPAAAMEIDRAAITAGVGGDLWLALSRWGCDTEKQLKRVRDVLAWLVVHRRVDTEIRKLLANVDRADLELVCSLAAHGFVELFEVFADPNRGPRPVDPSTVMRRAARQVDGRVPVENYLVQVTTRGAAYV